MGRQLSGFIVTIHGRAAPRRVNANLESVVVVHSMGLQYQSVNNKETDGSDDKRRCHASGYVFEHAKGSYSDYSQSFTR